MNDSIWTINEPIHGFSNRGLGEAIPSDTFFSPGLFGLMFPRLQRQGLSGGTMRWRH
jgi:hypothetical protein